MVDEREKELLQQQKELTVKEGELENWGKEGTDDCIVGWGQIYQQGTFYWSALVGERKVLAAVDGMLRTVQPPPDYRAT